MTCDLKKTMCILNAPLQIYEQDFTFLVNGVEFKTSRLVSDILSLKISRIHSIDPTFSIFTIKTHYNGDFSNILKLLNFNENNFPDSEFPFISEVIEILRNEHIVISNHKNTLTIDNVIQIIEQHEKLSQFYSKSLKTEIDFASSHFSQICENSIDEFRKLNIDSIDSIE